MSFTPKVRKRWWGWSATDGLEWCGRWPARASTVWRPTRAGAVAAAIRSHDRFVRSLERSNRWEQP